MTTLQQTLSAMKAREHKATKGPWFITTGNNESDGAFYISSKSTKAIAVLDGESSIIDEDNSEFIAAARTDVPKLIAIVEHLMETLTLSHNIHHGQRGHYLKQRAEELEGIAEKGTP